MKRVRDTSRRTYEEIMASGLLTGLREKVFDIVWDIGPTTGGVVATEMKKLHGVGGVSESVRNRLTELRNMGAIKEIDEVKCKVTNRYSILWDITGELPHKLEPKPQANRYKALSMALNQHMAYSMKLGYSVRTEITQFIDEFKESEATNGTDDMGIHSGSGNQPAAEHNPAVGV